MLNRHNGLVPAPAPRNNALMPSGELPHETLVHEVDIGRWWQALVRRRLLFAAIFGGFVLFVAILTLSQPKTYTTSTKLIAGSSSADNSAQPGAGSDLPALNALNATSGVQTAETYAELIQEPAVAQQVARDLKIADSNALSAAVSVKPVSDTSILTIFATWRNPTLSAQIANDFARVFVAHERELVAQQADAALAFLQNELPQAEQNLRSSQEALSDYQAQVGIADLPTQTQNDITSAAALDAKAQAVELDGRQAAAQLGAVEAQLARTPETILVSQNQAANPVSGQLDTQIATLKSQLSAARQQYTDDYPTVVSLKAQLTQAERAVKSQPRQVIAGTQTGPNPVYQALTQQAATLEGQISSAQAQATTVAGQRRAVQPKLDRLPEESRRIGELQRSVKGSQDVYDALQRKYQDATISKNTALSDVTITQPADATVYTSKPSIGLNLAIGILVGLALALGTVFTVEFFDDRFRTEADVVNRLGLPVLAAIPSFDERVMLKNADWVKPLSAEAFYQLVAALRYSSSAPPRVITFTSPEQGDGKSTVAVNTAISLSLMKARVLVIDADLRRPSVHTKLSITNESGLSDVLVGVTKLEDAIKPTDHAGVSVLTSGRAAPNPVGLLQSAAFDRLLERVRTDYDFVIVDGPALRSIVDGVVLGVKTDGTVLIVNSQKSDSRAVNTALAKLRSVGSVNLIGVVLNGTRPDAREHNDYYLGAGQSISLPMNSGG